MTRPPLQANDPEAAPQAARGEGGRALAPGLGLFAAFALLALGLYGETVHFALVGHDTYPIILSARIRNAADLAGTFTEELMDGRYTEGSFYRPAVNLSFALDYALYGLAPRGYHVTDLLLLGACAALLAALVLSHAGRDALPAALAAGLVFAVHPVHLNILPVAARRADALCLLFVAAALLAARARGRTRYWLPAVFTLLAAGAKETGAIAPILIFVQGLAGRRPAGIRPLGRAIAPAAADAALPLAALAAFFVARHAVIGGIGGHAALSAAAIGEHALDILPELLRMTFYPWPVFGGLLPAGTAAAALLLVTAAASLPLFRDPARRGLVAVAWVWMVAGWAVHGLSQTLAPDTPWYALHTAAPAALLFGLILHAAWRALRGRAHPVLKAAAAAIVLLLLVLVGFEAAKTPLFSRHPEWREASRLADRFLSNLHRHIAEAQPGTLIRAPELPFELESGEGSPIRLITVLQDYTVQAWAELMFPDRRVAVVPFVRPGGGPPLPPLGPDEIRVALTSVRVKGEVLPVAGD